MGWVLLVQGDQGRSARANHTEVRLWKPLVLVALAAYCVPLISPLIASGTLSLDLASTVNTQLTSLIAAVVALLVFRRVTIYPGARAFGFILPAFSTTFGSAAAILLVSRASYSDSMLLSGYIASVGMTFLLGYFNQRAAPKRMYYVPVGKTGIVDDTPDVDWIKLAEPVVPDDPNASIVVDLRSDHAPEWERMLAQAALSGIPVYHTKQLRESLTGRVQIEHLSENSFGSLLPALGYRGVKRTIDIIASVVLMPILLPLLIMVALLVRASSPGPILFSPAPDRLSRRAVRYD